MQPMEKRKMGWLRPAHFSQEAQAYTGRCILKATALLAGTCCQYHCTHVLTTYLSQLAWIKNLEKGDHHDVETLC